MNECIDRETAVKLLRDAATEGSTPYHIGLFAAARAIEAIPAADVQPAVKATWVVKEMEALFSGMDEHPVFACSECGYQIYDLLDNVKERHHYCPNCGARMEES